jgi:hypothetical protein
VQLHFVANKLKSPRYVTTDTLLPPSPPHLLEENDDSPLVSDLCFGRDLLHLSYFRHLQCIDGKREMTNRNH